MTTPAPSAGPVRFARYAAPPNRHGYCGPDPDEFAELAAAGIEATRELRRTAELFAGAYPYLELLAAAASADPLDDDVVEAYWLGNELLDRVDVASLGRSLDERFRHRAGSGWYRFEPAALGGCANHAFHVLVVSPWVGLMREGLVDEPLEIADRCRISWGQVRATVGDRVIVDRQPLRWCSRRLELGPFDAAEVSSPIPLAVGDVVSIHWGTVCEVLSPRQLAWLITVTRRQLRLGERIGVPA